MADRGNNRIRKISTDGIVSTYSGSTEGDSDGYYAKYNSPQNLAIDADGNTYVADTDNRKVKKNRRYKSYYYCWDRREW